MKQSQNQKVKDFVYEVETQKLKVKSQFSILFFIRYCNIKETNVNEARKRPYKKTNKQI